MKTKYINPSVVFWIVVLFVLLVCFVPTAEAFDDLKTLRVTATAYTSHSSQTDSTPFLAAWNNKLKPTDRIIAVSRDLLRNGLKNGSIVKIRGLKGTFTVRDKMNKRWKRKIDIYMGLDIKKALKWGRKKVTIIWS